MLQGKFVWYDIDSVTALPEGSGIHDMTVYTDFWWPVNDKGQISFFESRDRRSPQCNQNRNVAVQVGITNPDVVSVVKIKHVIVPTRRENYY